MGASDMSAAKCHDAKMPDVRQEPESIQLMGLWIILCLGVAFALFSDVSMWVKAICGMAALVAVWLMPSRVRVLWKVYKSGPKPPRNPNPLKAIRNPFVPSDGGQHAGRSDDH